MIHVVHKLIFQFKLSALAEAPTQDIKRTISVKESHLTESIGLSCDATTDTLVR